MEIWGAKKRIRVRQRAGGGKEWETFIFKQTKGKVVYTGIGTLNLNEGKGMGTG